jgi:hypothetical protein
LLRWEEVGRFVTLYHFLVREHAAARHIFRTLAFLLDYGPPVQLDNAFGKAKEA